MAKEAIELEKTDTKIESLQEQIATVESYKIYVSTKDNEKSVVDTALAYWDDVIAKTGDEQAIRYRKKIAENPKWYIELRLREAQNTLDVLADQMLEVSKEVIK